MKIFFPQHEESATHWHGYCPEKAIRNNAGMVPRENLEESVVRTGRYFPAGGNPCLSEGLTCVHADSASHMQKAQATPEFY